MNTSCCQYGNGKIIQEHQHQSQRYTAALFEQNNTATEFVVAASDMYGHLQTGKSHKVQLNMTIMLLKRYTWEKFRIVELSLIVTFSFINGTYKLMLHVLPMLTTKRGIT